MNERSTLIDISKYIAILFVVCGHLLNNANIGNTDMGMLFHVSHMPVFFMISGYLIFHELQKYNLSKLINNKIHRLLIPYLIWSAISFAFHFLIIILKALHLKTGFPASELIEECLQIFLYSRSVWFLIVLFISELIFCTVFFLSNKTKMPLILLLIFVYLFFCFFSGNSIFSLFKFKWLFPFFVMGFYFHKHLNAAEIIKKTPPGFIILFSACGLIMFSYLFFDFTTPENVCTFSIKSLNDFSLKNSILYQFVGLFGALFIFSLSILLDKMPINKEIAERGKYSLDIYVIHMFLLSLIPLPDNLIVARVAALAIAFIICEIIYNVSRLFLRKIHLYRISVGLKTKNNISGGQNG